MFRRREEFLSISCRKTNSLSSWSSHKVLEAHLADRGRDSSPEVASLLSTKCGALNRSEPHITLHGYHLVQDVGAPIEFHKGLNANQCRVSQQTQEKHDFHGGINHFALTTAHHQCRNEVSLPRLACLSASSLRPRRKLEHFKPFFGRKSS